jgi:hypothetical protein
MHSALTITPTRSEIVETRMGFAQVLGKPRRPQPDREQSIPAGTTMALRNAGWKALTTLHHAETPEETAPIVVPPLRGLTERFHLLQLWEGVVQAITEDGLVVTLVDKTNRHYPDEEATIPLAEIPEDDYSLLQPGAVLYWSIGYKEGPGQPRERISRIRVRRLPAWSKADIARAHTRAQQLLADLGSD